jgi:hypothetical protein
MARFTLFDKLGEPLKVRFDLNAVQDAEAMLGMGLMRAFQEQLGPRFLSILLWAGIKWDRKDVTPKEVTAMIQKGIRAKKCTMFDLQKFVLGELADSEALSGYGFDDEDEEGDKKGENPTKS